MKKIFLFLWNILKHIILFPFYCSLPHKYSGISYEEWLNGEQKDEPEDESKYY